MVVNYSKNIRKEKHHSVILCFDVVREEQFNTGDTVMVQSPVNMAATVENISSWTNMN
jgi:hypothetical protein